MFKNLIFHPSGEIEIQKKDRNYVLNLGELKEMRGFDQMNPYHPEGDLMEHVQQVVTFVGTDNPDVWLAAVFHDIGKPKKWQWHRKYPENRTFYGHDRASAGLFLKINERCHFDKLGFNVDKVHWLILNHIRIMQYDKMKLAKQCQLDQNPWFPELVLLRDADEKGRNPL